MPEGEREVSDVQVKRTEQGSVMSHGHMENSCCHMQGFESHMGDRHMHDGCVFEGNPNHSKDVQQPATASQHCSSDSPSEPPGGEPHARASSAHVQSLDQAHVDRRDREVRRDCATEVVHGRDEEPSGPAPRGAWCGAASQTAHGVARDGDPTEQSKPEESPVAEVLPRPGGASEWQRDHGHTPTSSHGEDLRDQHSRCQRPCGFRQGSCTQLPGDSGGPAVLPVGTQDMGRRLNVSTASPSSSLARQREEGHEREVRAGHSREDGDTPQRAYTSEDKDTTSSSEEHSQPHQCQQLQCHRSPGEPGRGHAGPQGGDQRAQERAPPQEGGQVVGAQLRDPLRDAAGDPNVFTPDANSVPTLEDPSFCESRRALPEAAARHLEQVSQSLVPGVFQGLVQQKRTWLMEVACSPNSVLSSVVQAQAGYEEAAIRCAHWNNYDLSTGEGVKLLLQRVDQCNPLHIWISTECGPFSPMQNLNQRTEQQKTELAEKRKEVLRQYVGASCVLHYAIQKGIHVTWEWSHKCHAWRLPLIQRIMEKYQMWVSVTNGCQVNLRDPRTGNHLHKGWKIMSTQKRMAQMLDLPCRCPKSVDHVRCEGSLTHQSAFYTVEFAKRVCKAIQQELSHSMVVSEMNGDSQLPPHFGVGPMCVCEELKSHDRELNCGACQEHTFLKNLGTENHNPEEHAWVQHGDLKGSRVDEDRINKQLYQLHAATGHGSVRHMIDALKKRGAPEHVMVLARKFTCHVCQERTRISHKHAAALEPLPPKWSVVSADGGKWIHPTTGEHVEFALIIDEGSQFRAARILCKGKHQTMSAAMFLSYLQEGWCQYFGNPQAIRLDPAGAFRSNEVERFCDLHGIYLDFIPGEAHWKLGTCEQAIQGVKNLMSKLIQEQPQLSAEVVLSQAVKTFNSRDLVRGFSPIQHALGRAPDEMGRCIQTLTGQSVEQLVPRAGPEFETSIELMRIAEQAHSEWTAQQRINKALNSRGNRQYQYHPGDLVYYWRKQVSGQKSTSAQQKQGCFLGPARILATETKREADGSLRPGSSVWVIRGRRLVKCCPEQLRPATQREELLEHITQDEQQQAPWTFSRLTQGLGGNEFEDITHELPDQQEWEEAQDSPMPPAGPPETPRHRVWGKRLGEGPERQLPDGTMYQPATRQRTGEPELADGLITQECWYSKTTEHSRQEAHETEFWQQPNTAIEIEIQNPDSKRQWSSFVNDFSGYFVGALKRRAIEVSEKKL